MTAVLWLPALLLLGGCISTQSGTEAKPLVLRTGETTRRDAVEKWGNPDAVFGDVWIWREKHTGGGKVKASFMMLGATVHTAATAVRERRLTFGPDGRLRAAERVEYTPGTDGWSINPWK